MELVQNLDGRINYLSIDTSDTKKTMCIGLSYLAGVVPVNLRNIDEFKMRQISSTSLSISTLILKIKLLFQCLLEVLKTKN